jgi:Predicted membrane protein
MSTKEFTEISIMIALTSVFEVIFSSIGITIFPNGGSVSLALLPLMVITMRLGFLKGLVAAGIYGIFQFVLPVPVFFLTPVQYLFDYIVPTLAAVLIIAFGRQKSQVYLGVVVVFAAKYLSHVIAGVVFWGEFAPEGFSAWTWSLYYNATYAFPSMVLSLIVVSVLLNRYPQLLRFSLSSDR